jgi:hypothetical protein
LNNIDFNIKFEYKMATWYECKFKYNREDQNGGFVTVTEVYLVDAVSFTDAETRVYQEVGSNYQEFVLLSVSKYKLHELVFKEEGLTWYKCKVGLTTLDEKSGKERKTKQTIVVTGNTVKEAYDVVEDLFSDSVSDYEILDIVTTAIVEVLPYYEDESAEPRIAEHEASSPAVVAEMVYSGADEEVE